MDHRRRLKLRRARRKVTGALAKLAFMLLAIPTLILAEITFFLTLALEWLAEQAS